MVYRKYKSQDISAVRDILANDLGYNCELEKLRSRVEEMMKRGNYQIFVACDGDRLWASSVVSATLHSSLKMRE